MADEAGEGTEMSGVEAVVPATPGAKLRAAREAQGLTLAEVAQRTRIAQRQLEAVERDDYEALPGIPYAVGFARAYARQIGVDEVAIAADVRAAVHASDLGANRYEVFEPTDPARVPSRMLAWTAVVIVLIAAAGYALWRTQILTPPTSEQIAAQEEAPAVSPAVQQGARPSPASQAVVLTATEDVWLRIYDEAGERLKDGLMKKGEVFTLPPNAANPMILTGRPQALSVTVGGKPVPPLGAADRTIADVPISAEALLARQSAAATPAEAAPAATTPRAPARTPGAAPVRRAPTVMPEAVTPTAPSSRSSTEVVQPLPSQGDTGQ